MASSQRSRETYPQKIVLLMLPVVGVIALRGLTFLRHPPQSVQGTNSTQGVDTQKTDSKEGITELKKYLTEATEATQDGNFTKAKSDYNEFHNQWKTIEEAFKEKSKRDYAEMEAGMAEVQRSLIDAATPDKNAALKGLQQLIRTLNTNG